MKWFTDFFGKKEKSAFVFSGISSEPILSKDDVGHFKGTQWTEAEVKNSIAQSFSDARFNSDLFDLCWDREALLVEIETAKKQKKKSSHLIAALARNTQRRLELELAHNGKSSA